MALEISILVGTMTGTARMVAQELELAFADDDVAIKVILMDGLDYRIFSQPGVFLICTSTYGQGDVPDNAKALYADLLARRPDLSSVRYGVFASFGGKTPRQMHPAACADCGVMTEVPFVPRGDRPVYCSSCYNKIRGATQMH